MIGFWIKIVHEITIACHECIIFSQSDDFVQFWELLQIICYIEINILARLNFWMVDVADELLDAVLVFFYKNHMDIIAIFVIVPLKYRRFFYISIKISKNWTDVVDIRKVLLDIVFGGIFAFIGKLLSCTLHFSA